MPDLVALTQRDGVAVVTIQNPPVNALSPGVPEGIQAAIDSAASDALVQAIVVIGAGRTFIAGADIRELEKAARQGTGDRGQGTAGGLRTGSGAPEPPASGPESTRSAQRPGGSAGPWHLAPVPSAPGPDLHALLQKIEDCPKPVVMAIHGTALGGGLEVAMAGHYRVAAPDAQMGLPETNLGIIPGGEGTQRLPRLVGAAAAVNMAVSGKPVKAAEALQLGLIDRIIEGDLLEGAAAFAREIASERPRKTRERNEKLGSPAENAPIFAAGREQARKTRRNLQAALAVVDALEAAVTLPFEEGRKRERAILLECLASDQCRALIHAFFAERAVAKIPDVPKETPVYEIRKAAIIGAGTMGGGIAMACANAGIPVILKDVDQSALDRGMSAVRKNYEGSVKKGRFPQETMDRRMALIQPQLSYNGFEDADLILEAAFESMDLKKQIFAETGKIAKPDCVLATNTSTLDLDQIAEASSRPEIVVGLHFFSPAHVMRLVEIVRGKATSKRVLATALALAKKLGKVGVVVGNCRGFVGNRMMLPYMREAQFLAEEGATPAQADRALYDFGMAMGIFAVDDMGGIDLAWRVRQEYKHLEKPGVRVPLVLDKLYEMHRWGQKTGAGWYRYGENRQPIPDPEVEALIEKTAREAGIERRNITDQEIVERCIYTLINEGAKILEEGYAQRAADIDVIYITGYGFPAYRGGPMWYADTVGLKNVYERVSEFHQRFGELWNPAPLLKMLAERGETFAEFDAAKERPVTT
ncbi:MAG TPA: 3-hydroxyacyl-CoA dehydrogenase NAD-binding domain-containing protein [Bryobacteraceae bacterium]|nr:3-hydroxyacyl-CoA dehydrogenase NAD-binding domain-containing protein [Bryobacteraceae bacterium]